MRVILLVGLLLLSNAVTQACEFTDVTFSSDFEMAKLDGCSKLSETSFLLQVKPENRPINHSPWYAFTVHSTSPKDIEININFEREQPRYLPKMSANGTDWKNLDFTTKDHVMTFRVKTTPSPVWIAGQELFGNLEYERWLQEVADNDTIQRLQLGESTHRILDQFSIGKQRVAGITRSTTPSRGNRSVGDAAFYRAIIVR